MNSPREIAAPAAVWARYDGYKFRRYSVAVIRWFLSE
jgi:hypothetical protein